jgi:hypothetical protein
MTPRTVRAVVLAVCAAGIAGMIVTSVQGNDGGALTFGLITAAAVLGLILVSAVAPPGAAGGPEDEEAAAAELEERVQALVREGADERAVRDLVRAALRLGRLRRSG